jgi:hypothetical protein
METKEINPLIKELVFKSNGYYQECCDSDTICFDPKDLELFVKYIIEEGEEEIDFISAQNLYRLFGFL